ncbi:MAG: GNAT family N-acetyltransferase [Oscillospiraceae bacterium]|nr:GNAT family N-acetyltransferase [Oscillospiraceae bacterium]
MEFVIKHAHGLHNMPDAAALRRLVFIKEQGFQNEFEPLDDKAVHFVCYADETPAGTGRLYEDPQDPSTVHPGRIAVRREFRGQHLGALLLRTMEQYAARQGYRFCVLSAQVRAQGFYEKMGYSAEGVPYMDEFCPHIRMKKAIGTERNPADGD